MTDNVTPIAGEDPIAALAREAEEELTKELNKTDMARIKASLRRIADAEKIVGNLKLEHDSLLRDLRAARNAA